MRVRLTLAAALALLAMAIVVTLSGAPLVVAKTNAIPADEPLLEARRAMGACQDGETLPAGTSAIRLTLVSIVGPRVSVSASSGARVLTAGAVGGGWTSGAVTVPVKALSHAATGVRLCLRSGPTAESVTVGGSHTNAALAAREPNGGVLPGRFTVEYMHRGQRSWWSLARTVATRMGLGRAPAGTWVAVLLALAMGAVAALAGWLAMKELG